MTLLAATAAPERTLRVHPGAGRHKTSTHASRHRTVPGAFRIDIEREWLEGGTGQRFRVSYHDHDTGVEGDWLADQDGNLVARLEAPFSEFLVHLHTHLHLPATWGLFIVGLTVVALLSSLVSGLLSHPRIFKDAFALRWGGSRRLQEADLHNRLGVWGLPFHIVVTLTGTLLGLWRYHR